MYFLLSFARTYPRPLATTNSIESFPPFASVAISWSGLIISISLSCSILRAVTKPSSLASRCITFTSSLAFLTTTFFKFRIICVTSSITPSIAWNSCITPSIQTATIADPGILDSITLLSAFPIVVPKPLSKGSSSNLPKLFFSSYSVIL